MNNKKPLVIFLSILAAFIVILLLLLAFYFNSGLTAEQKVVMDAGNDYNSGNIDSAISKTESIVLSEGEHIPALLLLATSYAEKGSVSFDETTYGQKAIDTANKVLALDPENSEAYRIIGYANEIMNKFDEARLNYDKAIELNPNNAQAYSNKGHSYDLQGDLEKASELYDKALSFSPNAEHALLNKARIQIRQMKLEDAKATISHLLESSSNVRFQAEGNQLLAFIYTAQTPKDYNAARITIEKSLSLDPTVPQAWVMRGRIDYGTLIQVSNSKEKLDAQVARIHESIDKALALNENQASAYFLASELAKVDGDPALVKEMEKKALEAIPNDITLGAEEKQALKDRINTVFVDVKTSKKI